MNTRELELLLKSVQSEYPIPKEPMPILSELLAMIKKLSASDSHLEAKDENLANILVEAVHHNHKEIVKALLDEKVNPNVKDKNGSLALHRAALNGHKEILNLLMNAEANVNAVNDKGITALFCSITEKKHEVISLLLEKKADPNGNQDCSLLSYAALTNQPDILITLLKAGAHPTNKKPSELDELLGHYCPDLDGNIRPGMKQEQIVKALPAIHLLLSKNALLNFPLFLYNYLRVLDQRNPLVKDSFLKLCEYLKKPPLNIKDERAGHILLETRTYLEKLEVVMEYKSVKKQELFGSLADFDNIAWDLAYNRKFDAKLVEKLYIDICKKEHPYLFMMGLKSDVKPKAENKDSYRPRV